MILSVSRRTDIPAFYSDWFYNRLKEGFFYSRNPMNSKQISNISLSPELIDCIVFWSKNPSPMLDRLKEVDKLYGAKYYFQFTLNPYEKDLEAYLPPKKQIIETFKNLSNKIGPERVVWRYDPIILTDKYDVNYHRNAFKELLKELAPYTKRCVVSFVDLYAKTTRNMREINFIEFTDEKMRELAREISNQAAIYNLPVESCAEIIDLSAQGIQHTHCIDANLIKDIVKAATGCDMDLDNKKDKDKSQRQECGCIASRDMGAYNTCLHGCKYCYANWDPDEVRKNFQQCDKNSPLLFGTVQQNEKVTTIDKKLANSRIKEANLFDR